MEQITGELQFSCFRQNLKFIKVGYNLTKARDLNRIPQLPLKQSQSLQSLLSPSVSDIKPVPTIPVQMGISDGGYNQLFLVHEN